jgi:hypothetical protein
MTLSVYRNIVSIDWMIVYNEVEGRFCRDSCVEGLRKGTKNLSQDSQCPSRDSNLALSEYKSEELPLVEACWSKLCSFQSR